MIEVLLVDDHELVRTGVKRLLEDEPGISVVAEAASGEQALRLARELRPQVVLMDLNMPGMGGLEATDKLLRRDPRIKVLVVTVYDDEPFPSQLIKAGAMGYVTKGCGIEEMVKAIKTVHRGQRYVSGDVAKHMAMHMLDGAEKSPFGGLSKREMEVLLLMTQGQSIQAISDRLCLSPKTIATYRYRLFDKVGVRSDVELMRLAIRHGIIDGGLAGPSK